MGMSAFYGPPKEESEAIKVIHRAVELGATFLDTSDVYGPHTNEILLGKALKGIRNKVQLATKFANSIENGQWRINGRPEYVKEACKASLERLDVDCIDLYYQHRVDPNVPIEDTVRAMAELVKEGKVKYLGLSEATADEIRRAHGVHPITAVQLEWSLWSRDAEEELIPTCRELGIGIVPYSPLGRGFFTGRTDFEAPGDFRSAHPRFQGENKEANMKLYRTLKEIADRKGVSPGQLALAWVQNQGDDVAPIPGTTSIHHLEENIKALSIKLSEEELKDLSDAIPASEVKGGRYPEAHMANTYQGRLKTRHA
ncbi:NAD(P)-linked oxidoreductase [Klebsormidium nitens]|uniref:NAD(P)-linked oxidoreductase n=1 Tax=Klebsormidium nitens TaxID=105231 RepID=A0A1Y1IJY0_KLENI|nr:NAD(P)-linked oxidoreductase [Klebsormidium nitens]|eukprot:GAQ88448.1 NAD(P)-linked oxidoreductase [Klebsormidium nitens]